MTFKKKLSWSIATGFLTIFVCSPANSFGFQETKEAEQKKDKVEQKKEEKKPEPTVSFQINEDRMTLKAPKAWKKKKPRFAMIEAEFEVKPKGKDEKAEGGRITVMKSGGSIPQNIARWKGQFEQEGDASTDDKTKVTKEKVQGMKVHFVEISGTFRSGGFGRPMKEKKNHRMMAAILEGGSMGNYYFKLTGPDKVVKANKKRFLKMVKSLKISL